LWILVQNGGNECPRCHPSKLTEAFSQSWENTAFQIFFGKNHILNKKCHCFFWNVVFSLYLIIDYFVVFIARMHILICLVVPMITPKESCNWSIPMSGLVEFKV
jgi:hypothetical protein